MSNRLRRNPFLTAAIVLAAAVVVLIVVGIAVAARTDRLGQFSLELGKFSTRLLEAVAWPVVLLAIAWVFREEIKERIRNLRSLTVGANKVEFAGSTNEAVQAADKLASETGQSIDGPRGEAQAQQMPEYARKKLDQAGELVGEQPKESVVAAFEPIKTMILEEAKRRGVVVVPEASLSRVLQHLPGGDDATAMKAVDTLERARKDALRVNGTVPEGSARGYVSAARTVAGALSERLTDS